METLLANLNGTVRSVVKDGREYLVAPLSLITPGVLNGSKGPLYYPPDEVGKAPAIWDGMPLVAYHPTDDAGRHVSAKAPGVLDKWGLGVVRNSKFYKGKLRAEGWFDAEKVANVDARLAKDRPGYVPMLPRLKKGEPIELSTGLFISKVKAPAGYTDHKNRPYEGMVARDYRSDHVAILPDQVGACSVKDGCGVAVANAASDQLDMTPEKACKILKDGKANGHKLTKRQRGMFGVKCGERVGNCGGKGGKPGPCPTAGHSEMTHKANELSRHAERGVADARDHYNAHEAHDAARAKYLMAGDVARATAHKKWADYHRRKYVGMKAVHPGKYVTNSSKGKIMFDRDETIQTLTANCGCWKGAKGQKILNAMTDDQLRAVATANAEPSEKIKKKAKQGCEDDMATNLVANSAAVAPSPALTPEQQATLNWAQEIVNREKASIVQRLIANVSDVEQRKLYAADLLKKTPAELNMLLALVPAPVTANRSGHTPGFDPLAAAVGTTPIYTAAGGAAPDAYPAAPVVNRDGLDDELLMPTTMNTDWAAVAKQNRG